MLRVLVRLLVIQTELIGLALRYAAWTRTGRGSPGPELVRATISRLGATFVKMGQALSLRRDLLSDAYIEALESLQDRAPPFSEAMAAKLVQRELGHPLTQLFASFEATPFAAASIAQVHAATLQDGSHVVVKIRRPNIRKEIATDMQALRLLVRVLLFLAPRFRRFQPLAIIEEIRRNLDRETDFRRESKNISFFSRSFAAWGALQIPKPIAGLVSEGVLVQERSGGLRIDDPSIGPQGPSLAQNLIDAYLHQIFVLGVFHGDPHPGNLFITKDQTICFHDFGLVGVLDRRTRRTLAAFTEAFLLQDAEWMLDCGIDLGILPETANRRDFVQGLTEILADFAALPLREWSLAEAFLAVTRLDTAHELLVPHNLLVLLRAIFLAENAVRVLDPEFQLLAGLQAKGPQFLAASLEPSAEALAKRARAELMGGLFELPAALKRARDSAGVRGPGAPDRAPGRWDGSEVAHAIVAGSLFVAGALMFAHPDNAAGPMSPWLVAAPFAAGGVIALRLLRHKGRR